MLSAGNVIAHTLSQSSLTPEQQHLHTLLTYWPTGLALLPLAEGRDHPGPPIRKLIATEDEKRQRGWKEREEGKKSKIHTNRKACWGENGWLLWTCVSSAKTLYESAVMGRFGVRLEQSIPTQHAHYDSSHPWDNARKNGGHKMKWKLLERWG